MTVLVTTNAWLIELRTRLPGISEGQLGLELKSTLREFFTKSGFWMEELDPIDIVSGQPLYPLSHPGAVVMGVHYVYVNGNPVGLSDRMPKNTSPSTRASLAYMVEAKLLQLFPEPSEDISGGLKVIARLNPTATMDLVPSETVSHFFDEVMDGVLGRLYSQPGKPFTNLIQSQYHLKRFRDGMAMARDMGRRRYSTAARSWAYPQGWAGNNFRRGNSRTA